MPAFSVAELFSEDHLVLDLQGASSGEAIWEIVERLRANGDLAQAEKFYAQVMAREQKSSTVANGGVAFPHARTDLVQKIVLGIGRSQRGVNFTGRVDLVQLIFVIGVPQQMVNDYLICVGALARLLKSAERREKLLAAETGAQFLVQLRGEN